MADINDNYIPIRNKEGYSYRAPQFWAPPSTSLGLAYCTGTSRAASLAITPSGTYTATSMNKIWYSKQWDNAPMPHSIFFMKDGHAIHGSLDVKNLGKPVSHGCVRISPENAATERESLFRTSLGSPL